MRERKTCGFSANAKGSRKAGDTSSKRRALLDNPQITNIETYIWCFNIDYYIGLIRPNKTNIWCFPCLFYFGGQGSALAGRAGDSRAIARWNWKDGAAPRGRASSFPMSLIRFPREMQAKTYWESNYIANRSMVTFWSSELRLVQ